VFIPGLISHTKVVESTYPTRACKYRKNVDNTNPSKLDAHSDAAESKLYAILFQTKWHQNSLFAE
jgi:hypothetical protein